MTTPYLGSAAASALHTPHGSTPGPRNSGLWASGGPLPWDASRVGRAVPQSAESQQYFLVNEHERTIEQLQKENFGLKLRIFYLEEDDKDGRRKSSRTPRRHSHAHHHESSSKLREELLRRDASLEEQKELLLKARSAIEHLQNENTALIGDIDELRAWKNANSTDLQRGPDLMAQIQALESEKADLTLQIELKTADSGHLTAELSEKERVIASLQDDVKKLTDQQMDHERERGVSEEVLRSLRAHIDGLTTAKEGAEAVAREREGALERLQSIQHTEAAAEMQQLQRQLHETKIALSATEKELVQVKGDSQSHDAALRTVIDRAERAEDRTERAEAACSEIRAQSSETMARADEAVRTASFAEKRAEEAEAALKAAQTRCQDHTSVILRLSRELEDARDAGIKALESADVVDSEREARALAEQRAEKLAEHNRLLILEMEERRSETQRLKDQLKQTNTLATEVSTPFRTHVATLAAQIEHTQRVMEQTREVLAQESKTVHRHHRRH